MLSTSGASRAKGTTGGAAGGYAGARQRVPGAGSTLSRDSTEKISANYVFPTNAYNVAERVKRNPQDPQQHPHAPSDTSRIALLRCCAPWQVSCRGWGTQHSRSLRNRRTSNPDHSHCSS